MPVSALDEAIAKFKHDGAHEIAEVYAWRGENDKAFEWLLRVGGVAGRKATELAA